MKNLIPVSCAVVIAGVVVGVKLTRRTAEVEAIVWYGNAAHPYIEEVRTGVEAYARDSGVAIYRTVGQEWTQDNQNQNVEALSTRGHRSFALYPSDPAGANGLFTLLTKRGCRIVAFGAEPELPTPASFTIATDISEAARVATRELIRLMGGRGRILNALEAVTDVNTVKRDRAIREVVAEHPEVEIVQTLSDMIQIGEATTKLQSALAARGESLDGIIATGFNPTVAAAAILTEWHKDPRHKRIRFVGIDTDTTVLQAIREGAIDATVAQNPFGHGYVSGAILDRMEQGWTPRETYQFIDSGLVVVRRANLDTFSADVRAVTDRLLEELPTRYLRPPE
jgi:ribose transport system substrate-binding protein